MYFVHILQSTATDWYYVGSTHDVQLRRAHHSVGWSRSTKSGRPWHIVSTKVYPDRSGAQRSEYEIKQRKGRTYIEALIATLTKFE